MQPLENFLRNERVKLPRRYINVPLPVPAFHDAALFLRIIDLEDSLLNIDKEVIKYKNMSYNFDYILDLHVCCLKYF